MPKRAAAFFMCGYRWFGAALACQPETMSCKIVQWRAAADEDGHYCFAVAL
jgi:hypothetical protein